MIEKSMQIKLASGLEARPVAVLVQKASQHDSSIYLQSGDKKVNAKSIMGMMSLSLNMGEKVTVIADGVDEEDAVQSIERYLSGKEAM
jgi:catabolite repression HPr-like protein